MHEKLCTTENRYGIGQGVRSRVRLNSSCNLLQSQHFLTKRRFTFLSSRCDVDIYTCTLFLDEIRAAQHVGVHRMFNLIDLSTADLQHVLSFVQVVNATHYKSLICSS